MAVEAAVLEAMQDLDSVLVSNRKIDGRFYVPEELIDVDFAAISSDEEISSGLRRT